MYITCSFLVSSFDETIRSSPVVISKICAVFPPHFHLIHTLQPVFITTD